MPKKTITAEPEQDPVNEDVVFPEEFSGELTDENSEENLIASEPVPERSASAAPGDNILTVRSRDVGLIGDASESRKWGYLAGAVRRKQILPGVVSELVKIESVTQACAIDFEGLRVIIPYREMTLTEWPADEGAPSTINALMRSMLGATVDFIPAAVDINNRAAVGSRKAAMLERQKSYYESKLIMPGVRVACNVLAVGGRSILVNACGVDTTIPAHEVSWEWFSDVSELHSSGDVVIARVKNVEKNEETGLYSVNLSVRAAMEHPDKVAFSKLVLNTTHFGVVTGVKNGVYFIRLQSGVNAKTKVYRCRERPGKHDSVAFQIKRLDEDHLVAYGFITRIVRHSTILR